MVTPRSKWPYPTKLTISILVLIFVVYLLNRFRVVISPFILAVILAYIITPLTNFLHSKFHLPRLLSIFLSYLMLVLSALTIPLVLIPLLTNELRQVNLDFHSFYAWLDTLRGSTWLIAGQVIDLENIINQIVISLEGLIEPIISQTLGLVVDVVTSVVWVIFIFIVSFYLVKDARKLHHWIESVIPTVYRSDFLSLRNEISLIWSAFFRGQLLLALVVACIFIAVGFILGLPFALLLGILAGLLEFLPSIGHGIWLFTASLLTFTLGSTWIPLPNWAVMLILIGLHIVFQQLDLNYLIPRIIGRRVQLHPLVVILGIVTGAVLAGVIGIPLAAPTIASVRIIARYIFANLFDQEPFPPELSMSD